MKFRAFILLAFLFALLFILSSAAKTLTDENKDQIGDLKARGHCKFGCCHRSIIGRCKTCCESKATTAQAESYEVQGVLVTTVILAIALFVASLKQLNSAGDEAKETTEVDVSQKVDHDLGYGGAQGGGYGGGGQGGSGGGKGGGQGGSGGGGGKGGGQGGSGGGGGKGGGQGGSGGSGGGGGSGKGGGKGGGGGYGGGGGKGGGKGSGGGYGGGGGKGGGGGGGKGGGKGGGGGGSGFVEGIPSVGV